MNTHLQTYIEKAERFSAVVGRIGPDQWGNQSPCEKWTAADVVDHVVDSQRDFLSRHRIGIGPRPEGAPDVMWRAHRDAVLAALDDETLDRSFDGYFGPTTIGATMANFYGFDLIVHRWDLGRAADLDEEFTTEEMDLMEAAIAGFGDHMYADGVFQAALPAPPDASRQERLLAVMGRTAA